MPMIPADAFRVTFFGTRGSFPSPGEATRHYGGHTSCLMIEAAGSCLFLDAGSGILNAPSAILGRYDKIDILFSHTHLDHILGLPGFLPATRGVDLRFWAGHWRPPHNLKEVLSRLMSEEVFPLPLEQFDARCRYESFQAGEDWMLGAGVSVKTAALNHPGGATAYRIEADGKSLVYATDHEIGNAAADAALVRLLENANVAILDAAYTDAEWPRHQGWGHSSWQASLALATRAGVERPVLFHHEPTRTDAALDAIARDARSIHSGAILARDGLVLDLSANAA